MDDVGLHCPNGSIRLHNIAQREVRRHAAPLHAQRDQPETLGGNSLAGTAGTRCHSNIEAGRFRPTRHREEMRDEEPIFSDQVKQRWHPSLVSALIAALHS